MTNAVIAAVLTAVFALGVVVGSIARDIRSMRDWDFDKYRETDEATTDRH